MRGTCLLADTNVYITHTFTTNSDISRTFLSDGVLASGHTNGGIPQKMQKKHFHKACGNGMMVW